MNYLKIDKASMVDGPGVRVVLWVAGCSVHCSGCHNPESHDFNAGQPFTEDAMNEIIEALKPDYIKGFTFSGGNPVESPIVPIAKKIKEIYPEKDIWVYCGWNLTFADIFLNAKNQQYFDVIVDGPYKQEERDITIPYRGSRNQRLIDVKETIKKGEIIEWKQM